MTKSNSAVPQSLDNKRGKMRLDDYVFECKQQAGRKTLDKAALAEFLAEHGKDISDFEKQGAPFTVLKVEEIAGVV